MHTIEVSKLLEDDPATWLVAIRFARTVAARRVGYSARVDVDDVVQEACIRLRKELPEMRARGIEDARAAIALDVKYAALDLLRAACRGGHCVDADVEGLCDELGSDAGEVTRAEQLVSPAARACVEQVLATKNGMIFSSWMNGERLVELCKQERIPLGTLHRHLRAASEALRRCLGNEAA